MRPMTARSPKNPRGGSPSSLSTGVDRFLSQVVAEALDENWRTPENFLSHFGPRELMEGLANDTELRAQLLVTAAGVHEKLARKKSTTSAAEDLELALAEGLTDARQIVTLIPVDDRVRCLSKPKLWTFAFEDRFWTASDSKLERAAERMTFVLQTALDEGLLTLEQVFNALGIDEIAKSLPADELRRIVTYSLNAGRKNEALTEEALLDLVPFTTLFKYVPLGQVWDRVILEIVARPAHLAGGSGGGAGASGNGEATRAPTTSAASVSSRTAERSSPKASPPAELPSAEVKPAPQPRAKVPSEDMEVNLDFEVDPREERPQAEQEARDKAITKLKIIERLPPSHESLSTPILLSIDSMYEELLDAEDDDDREAAIRDSFPNEALLSQALLALIELLDPTIDTAGSVMQGADVASLIKVVLFEERRRTDQDASNSKGAGSAPPRRASPSGGPAQRASAPPGPKSSLPPPPPLVKRPR